MMKKNEIKKRVIKKWKKDREFVKIREIIKEKRLKNMRRITESDLLYEY